MPQQPFQGQPSSANPSMDRPSLWRRGINAWRRDGFLVAAANGLRKLGGSPLARLQNAFDGRIDRRYGLDTRGIIHPADMPFANPHKEHATNYQPTTERTFRSMMASLPRSLAGFDFIDIGCGKGRVLFYASERDFERIVGIEFAPPLAAMAKCNVDLFARATGENRNEVHCQDAADMILSDRPCVLFFASPFMDEVLVKVASRIESSWRANPRKMFVIYYGYRSIPDIVTRFGFLKPIAQGVEWRDLLARGIYPYAVFESPD